MDAEAFLGTLRKDVLDPEEYADISGVNEEIAGLLPVNGETGGNQAAPLLNHFSEVGFRGFKASR